MQESVLLVDDEQSVVKIIQTYLEREKFRVYCAGSGAAALEIISRHSISLIILDLMLPDVSGETLCKELRKSSNIPIIMLTAKSAEQSMLNGFSCGADDYIIKPFSPKEVVARAVAVLRRASANAASSNIMNFEGGLSINLHMLSVTKNGTPICLTPCEYKLLRAMVNSAGSILSRDSLLEAVFTDSEVYDRTIDAHIKNLRHKIEDNPRKPLYIHTEYGFGYKFEAKTTQ